MLKLSWDLFIVVLFAVIIAYSFIIGKERTLKIIIGSYLAILTADGLGNIFHQYALSSQQFVTLLRFFGFANQDHTLITLKIFIFIAAIVILAVRGGFEVTSGKTNDGVVHMIITLIFGFLSAGLIMSTLLVYVSGASFVGGTVTITNNALSQAYSESEMIKLMIKNYNFWFAIPAVSFLIVSLFNKKEV